MRSLVASHSTQGSSHLRNGNMVVVERQTVASIVAIHPFPHSLVVRWTYVVCHSRSNLGERGISAVVSRFHTFAIPGPDRFLARNV